MSRRKDDQPPTTEQVLDAAIQAQLQMLDKHGKRDSALSRLDDKTRVTIEESQDRFAERMRRAGRPGW